jgi:hypothetical protein
MLDASFNQIVAPKPVFSDWKLHVVDLSSELWEDN